MYWLLLLAVIGLALIYIFIVRPLLKESPLLSPVFKAEATLFEQVQAKVAGWKTKIASRLVVIAGVLVESYNDLLPLVSGQDWTPVTKNLPPWAIPVGLVLIGWLFSYLNKVTKEPAAQVITQKMDDGSVQVVALSKLPPAS